MQKLSEIFTEDKLLLAIFEAIDKEPIDTEEKLKTLVRAGRIAEIYRSGLMSHELFQNLRSKNYCDEGRSEINTNASCLAS